MTRKNILRIAWESGVKVREEAVPVNIISSCQEAFISNTSAELSPVTEMGGITIGDGKPGPVARLLREKFDFFLSLQKF